MISTRQTVTEEKVANVIANGEAAILPADNGSLLPPSSTASIQSTLIHQTTNLTNPSPDIAKVPSSVKAVLEESALETKLPEMFESFIVINTATPLATLREKVLVHTQSISDNMKSELGVKRSAHTVEVLTCNDYGCDIIFSPASYPRELNLNELPGKEKACYILTSDKKMYYADKQRKLCTDIPINKTFFEILCQKLQITLPTQNSCSSFEWFKKINDEEIKYITALTKHLHSMAYYKENHDDSSTSSTMAIIEAVNSTAYQLLSPRHFPTCYAVCNEGGKYIGVASKSLPGFKPNRNQPLEKENLNITSLKNMVKIRDERDISILKYILKDKLNELIILLKRPVDTNCSYFYQGFSFLSNNYNYYLGYPTCAVQIIKKFITISGENVYSVKFGVLDELRQLLLDRKSAIGNVQSSYFASQHKHMDEVLLIDDLIAKLNVILLDEQAVYTKHLHRISRKLQEDWVDIDAEIAKNKEACIQIDEGEKTGLKTKLDVKLEDIRNYRNTCGLAIGLTARYFMQDSDGHARNLSSNGCNVDGDRAVEPLTFRFRKLPKPGANYFILDLDDFTEFPNLKKAKFRYWPTVLSKADTSIDAALSIVCDVTTNYFVVQDSQNYQSLENSPVFNFQKYVQLIILSLTNKDMYTALAKLHMPDNLQMLNDNYEPIPLINEHDEPNDVRTNWIKCCSDRAIEGRNLAKRLPTLREMLNRQGDLILEMVQDHFDTFVKDREMELNEQACNLIQECISPNIIKTAFLKLKEEILAAALENSNQITIETTPRAVII